MAKKLIDGIWFGGRDLTGSRFGRLVVSGLASSTLSGVTWECVCACGNKGTFQSGHLKSGTTKSCGCLQREKTMARSLTHSGTRDKLYGVWKNMKTRCSNKSVRGYKDYGGRGIKVCDRWSEYANFRADMASTWRPGLTIDRRDNDGPYSPDNCRWSSAVEQGRNKRNNRLFEFMGEIKCISELAESFKINHYTVINRIKRGWSIERALTTTPRHLKRSQTNKIE